MTTKALRLPLAYPLEWAEPSFQRCREAFATGADSPRAYLERRLDRLTALEPALKAFVHLDLEGARSAADISTRRYAAGAALSEVDGMPIGIKDIIETRTMPTQMGSVIYAGFRPRRNAPCVVALLDAGAVALGKTVTTEFAVGRPGPTCNPFDPTRTPGGSSSGSAAAVGAGLLPAALGTQTLGSIVRPASYCGAFGWKPTHGAFATDGVQSLSPTLDHLGVIAQHIDDAWAIATVLASTAADPLARLPLAGTPSPQSLRPRRLVVLRTIGWPEADEESKASFAAAVQDLRSAGVDVLDSPDAGVTDLDRRMVEAADVAWRIFAWESRSQFRSYRDCGEGLIGERLLELLATAECMNASEYAGLLEWRTDLRRVIADNALHVDGFVSLSSSGPAPRGLAETGSRSFPVAWTLLGGPSLSIPVLRSSGLPLGLQLMGTPHSDTAMVGHARWLADHLQSALTSPR